MDFNKLTIKSGEAVAGAQELARRMGNPELTPDHLAIALLDQELPRTLVERAGASAESIRAEAESAAQLAYDLAYGVAVPATMTNGKTVDNGSTSVPALLVSPVAVTRQTIISTVIADGFLTKADLCTDQFAKACVAVGIS